MKWLLIAMAFNLQVTYPNQDTCEEARDILKAEAPLGKAGSILCIPAGVDPEDKMDMMFTNFIDLVMKLEEINQKKLTKE
tara:strand:- start:467 stop:706 length:240 start_codon:yes stop_codon:yes gene_type:complete